MSDYLCFMHALFVLQGIFCTCQSRPSLRTRTVYMNLSMTLKKNGNCLIELIGQARMELIY